MEPEPDSGMQMRKGAFSVGFDWWVELCPHVRLQVTLPLPNRPDQLKLTQP